MKGAFLIIDVQSDFASPWHGGTFETRRIAKNIASAAKAFRRASIPIYAV